MSIVGELLFVRRDRVDLDAALRHQSEFKVRELVDAIPDSDFATQTDEELTERVYRDACVMPLNVAFDKATPSVQEVPFETNSVFGERVRLKGLRATKSMPFTGDPNLWHLLTVPRDLNPPHGAISGQTLVVGIVVQEQEGEQAKMYISDTISRIKTYLDRQATQLDTFNSGLPGRIKAIVQQRRTRLDKASDLLKKLQE